MGDDIERDIRDHIEMETRENLERGMAPAEARAAALRTFGNPLRIAEETRAVWRSELVERLLQDIRYAVRGLRRNPLFAAVVILTLALGIGLNTAVFSVVNAVLIEPLHYPHPERLVWLTNFNKAFKVEIAGGPDFVDWRARAQSFDKMFCYEFDRETIAYGDTTIRPMVAEVSEDFWPVTGVKPAAGRLFRDADQDVMVLSYALYERVFGADAAIVGKTILVDGHPLTVVGVLPPGFRFLFPAPTPGNGEPAEVEAYVPTDVTPANQVRGRSNVIVNVVARLKPGVCLGAARGEMEAIQARIVQQYSNILNFRHLELRVVSVQERLVGNARPALLILLGAVTFVLLIACANIAGLLLARASTRRREVAIRAAVGAGRLRMIAQFVTEGLVLAVAGGAAGLLVARWAIALLSGFGPSAAPRLEGVAIDGRVLVFTAAISMVSGLLFGLGPALSLARANLHSELKEGGKATAGVWRLRLRSLLVAGELAAALVLLIGAGLMVKSLWRMNARPAGFHPESILVVKASLTGDAYRGRDEQIAYFEEALTRLQGIPGVVAAGTVFSPMRGVVQMEGAPFPAPDLVGAQRGSYYSVSSGYFRVVGVELLQGRWMSDDEPAEALMVNEAFVRRILGGASPLGKSVHLQFPNRPPSAPIVGVVSDVKHSTLDGEPEPEVYFPYRQSFYNGASDIVVRVLGDAAALAPTVRRAIAEIDGSQPAFEMQSLESALARTIAPRRFNLFLLGTFAGSALLLSVIGIYGAMAYAVTQRTHEIGVRMALGARRGEIVRMVVRQGMVVALTGIVSGTAAAFGLTRLMAALLYDVKSTDPWTFAAVAIALTVTSLLASWIPALQAARVDPLRALRYE
jgi:putative ABC transport system permease protein